MKKLYIFFVALCFGAWLGFFNKNVEADTVSETSVTYDLAQGGQTV
ncbi:hypothetical protein LPAF129_18200 [Ligilactobacillus pabuli]|uniref:Uncharacterized protein n=1 Tax=Ligilactobacillus pabuli TaxID=2886039 RepID=A0ABQ5JJ35_9LACO|nr:hypothetical protein [Ligilactobacillus pabuli]GKS82134.1 hypothetical protein LPAF129_18200 [Ligilactobacillus pabuli]HIW89436.1 hypothetical protein [Candidatus Ligilactobacillus excrementipullorum]